jgi:hypothetical protein
MIAALMLAGALAGEDCTAFAARLNEPVAIRLSSIPSEALGGRPLPIPVSDERPAVAIGDLAYRGYGLTIRSSDARFRDLVVQPGVGSRHPCGFVVEGPSGWNAFDANRSRWNMVFKPQARDLAPAATLAAEHGARPVLAGFRASATSPVYTGGTVYFIGLMHPAKRSETVIVAFADSKTQAPARILARLPLRIDEVSITPGLHTPQLFLNLEGRDEDGALNRFVLEMSDETARRYGAALPASPP